MTDAVRDTGDVAEVPEDERLGEDGGEGSVADLDEELDEELANVFAAPGDVVSEEELL